MLAVLVAIYGSLREGVFTLEELNIDTAAAMTLLLAATGQTIVLLRGGIDLSIGGMISLGTVIAATQFGDDWWTATAWGIAIIAIGFGVGALNGVLISVLRLQPFLVTLATWSILSGAALLILPTDGGQLPDGWMSFGNASFLGLSTSVWILVFLFLFWLWFRSTRLGIAIRATGSNEKSAFLSGVSLLRINVLTYGLSGVFAALAALYLTTQTGAGSPTIGKDYILASVAAAVIGGISLFGGRGGLSGTIVGAFILTIIGNLVFVLSRVELLAADRLGRDPARRRARQLARREVGATEPGMSAFLTRNRAILLAYLGMVVLLLLTSLFSPGFLSGSHLRSMSVLAAFIGIVALGQTLVIIGGGIDLSVPWVLNCAAIMMTLIAGGQDEPLIWAIPLILAAGAAVGAINGAGVALFGVPPIIMTLAVNVILQGSILVYTGGAPPATAPQFIQFLAVGRIGFFPVVVIIWIVLAIAASILLSKTAFGRQLYAVGSSPTVAEFSGVPIVRTTVSPTPSPASPRRWPACSSPATPPRPISAWATPTSSPRSPRSRSAAPRSSAAAATTSAPSPAPSSSPSSPASCRRSTYPTARCSSSTASSSSSPCRLRATPSPTSPPPSARPSAAAIHPKPWEAKPNDRDHLRRRFEEPSRREHLLGPEGAGAVVDRHLGPDHPPLRPGDRPGRDLDGAGISRLPRSPREGRPRPHDDERLLLLRPRSAAHSMRSSIPKPT